ncbi:hypothetical protein F8E02_02130 [Methanoculleus sp. Wushi-C6]|uniref:FAS1 domain-containing protein n=1 Tax=Methanoculleus caldifontis TaxID=2651577 RepID=A0ABU3WYD9_9EURY|nr:fasciclin domain-containing protein [Methanoculleus sp. Wushi-C6]MDV2480824.1 hypothetical protein [Methanoculleus sp. Wushi-C6]
MILCLLTLTGAVAAVSAQETPQQIGAELEYELPMDTMKVIGRYNVTIDPAENVSIEPVNLDTPIDVRRDTPIGALDAVAQSEGLNFTTYYYTVSGRLAVDSINDYVYEEDQIWYVLNYLNETFHETSMDAGAHNLTDNETFWLIYCDLSDYDPRYESRVDRAVAGLSITVTFSDENVTPTPTPDENVTPGPTENVTPTPTPAGNVTPGPGENVTPMPTIPGILVPIPTATPGNVTPDPNENVIPANETNIYEAIGEEENLSILASLLNVTDLAATLRGEGPYTIFAPDNDAFGNLSSEVLAMILVDEEELTRVLSNHVVNGSYTAAELLNMTEDGNETTLTTLAGLNLTVSESDGVLMIGNATVGTEEINATNGVVHVIDTVLIPTENVTETATPVENMTPAENATPVATTAPLTNMTGPPMGAI